MVVSLRINKLLRPILRTAESLPILNNRGQPIANLFNDHLDIWVDKKTLSFFSKNIITIPLKKIIITIFF